MIKIILIVLGVIVGLIILLFLYIIGSVYIASKSLSKDIEENNKMLAESFEKLNEIRHERALRIIEQKIARRTAFYILSKKL